VQELIALIQLKVAVHTQLILVVCSVQDMEFAAKTLVIFHLLFAAVTEEHVQVERLAVGRTVATVDITADRTRVSLDLEVVEFILESLFLLDLLSLSLSLHSLAEAINDLNDLRWGLLRWLRLKQLLQLLCRVFHQLLLLR